jgi:hypothetical protein
MDYRAASVATLWIASALLVLACSGSKGARGTGGARGGSEAGLSSGGSSGQASTGTERGGGDGGGTQSGSDAGQPSGGSGGTQISTGTDRERPDGGGGTANGSDAGQPSGGSGGTQVSTGTARGGSGGGTSSSSRGGTGGASSSTVACSTVARCPAKVVDGDLYIHKDNPAKNYLGTTEFTGDVTFYTLADISSFDCLETVDGRLIIAVGNDGESLAGAFPNLRRVGLYIEYSRHETSIVDACTFRSLETVGSFDMWGSDVSGELNLGSLRQFFRIEVRSSLLRQLTLPSNGTFTAGQLRIERNANLTNIYGFENVQLTGANAASGSYSVYISNNPRLARCRAHDLAQVFLDAGYSPAAITVESSGTCP